MYPFLLWPVNVFVLISGYFSIRLDYKKLLSLNWLTTFYSISFFLIFLSIGIVSFNPTKSWMYLFPVITKQYWFITIYFALCLLSPFLNILIEHLSKKDFEKLLMVLFCLFAILPTFAFAMNFPSITEDAGYGIANFIFLYLLGRYIRLHYHYELNRNWFFAGFLITCLACGLVQAGYSILLGFPFTSFHSYDTIFVQISAVCLFMYFRQLQFSQRIINYLAKSCLAVYVIHMNLLQWSTFTEDMLCLHKSSIVDFLATIVIAPVLIYLLCVCLEYVRTRLFAILRIN